MVSIIVYKITQYFFMGRIYSNMYHRLYYKTLSLRITFYKEKFEASINKYLKKKNKIEISIS